MTKAAHQVLPKKPRNNPGWFKQNEQELSKLIAARNSAVSAKINRPTRFAIRHLKICRKNLKSAINRAKNKWIENTCTGLKDSDASQRGTKVCWDKVKTLQKGLEKPMPPREKMMTKEDGSKCKNPQENAEVFKTHFQKLYGRTPHFDESVVDLIEQKPILNDLHRTPSEEEILVATNHLKNKSPGESGLNPQMFKVLVTDNLTFRILKDVIVDFWENELPPKQWEIGLLKILPKKGDLSKPGNYRGIMLLEAVYKIVAKIVHSRLQPTMESLDHEAQCGFRSGRGCCDAVFSVKLALKKRREHSKETWVLFLDLVKAFDRVPRDLLWTILHRFGVSDKLVSILKSLHNNINVKFTVDDVTHNLNCLIGVKQGDILGPILFTFFIAAVMITWRSAHKRPLCMFRSRNDFNLTGRKPNAKGDDFSFDDSEYADDTAVLFGSRAEVETFCPLLIQHFLRFGMEVHVGDIRNPDKPSKTEILFVAAPKSLYTNPSTLDDVNLNPVTIDEHSFLPIVDHFCYLGSILSRDCKDDADVSNRIRKAGNAFGALRKCIFANSRISLSTKRFVYEGLVLPILLYGSESWCLTEKLFNLLRLFHRRCIRSMCGVTMKDVFEKHLSNDDLLMKMCLLPIDGYVSKRQLRWLGHVARMSYDRLPRKMLSSWVPSKRPKGAPEFTYGRGIFKCFKKCGIDRNGWNDIALDRLKWNALIANV